MRIPWNNGHPPVIVHNRREQVMKHWCYSLSKSHLDEKRALLPCEQLHQEDALGRIYDLTFEIEPAPLVVAPARPLGATQNALGRTFARKVAQELGFEMTNEIYQNNAVRRNSIRSPFFRMSQSPTFDGTVVAGPLPPSGRRVHAGRNVGVSRRVHREPRWHCGRDDITG